MRLWVDTDFGFDDLWALLLLRRFGAVVEGISLVAGNTPLNQVALNAMGAREAFGIDAPLHKGAARPLLREAETAQRILGETGMPTRGRTLPPGRGPEPQDGAISALAAWLERGDGPRNLLALGPLTNIAALIRQTPEAARRITRLVWMGGGDGTGNHTPAAEFNAFADPEAAEIVARAGLPFEVVDLSFCRKVQFGPGDMPECDDLIADLLGGYLDIGLSRGRAGMAIYDPLAALAMIRPDLFQFEPCRMMVSLSPGASYGATAFTFGAGEATRLAVNPRGDLAPVCLSALAHGASA